MNTGKCALCPAHDDLYPCGETSCPDHYPMCLICLEPIEHEAVSALDCDFHPDCASDLWTALSHHFSYILRDSLDQTA